MVGGMGHEEEEGRFVTTMMSIEVMVMAIVIMVPRCVSRSIMRGLGTGIIILLYHYLWDVIVTLISGSMMII